MFLNIVLLVLKNRKERDVYCSKLKFPIWYLLKFLKSFDLMEKEYDLK